MASVELRVENGTHRETVRSEDSGGNPTYERRIYEAGDTFEVAAEDLDRYEALLGGRLSIVDPEPEPDGDDPEPKGEDDEDGDEGEGDEAPPPEEAGLTAEWVRSAEYPELRSAAGEIDDVNGNWDEERLREALLEYVEG